MLAGCEETTNALNQEIKIVLGDFDFNVLRDKK